MAGFNSSMKRQKERIRQEQQQKKKERAEQRRREAANRPPAEDGVDPDIAGIVPGPQPPREDQF